MVGLLLDWGVRETAAVASTATVETAANMAGVTWEATIRLPQNGDQVRVRVVAPTQFDAKQLVELQYGRGNLLFGTVRVDLTRPV
jgi:hypothetical protein